MTDPDQTSSRPPKKTDVLEVRIAPETKRDFMDACRAEGRSASDAVREMIETFLERRKGAATGAADMTRPKSVPSIFTRFPGTVRVGAGGVAVAAMIAAFGLAAGRADDLADAQFKRRDADSDGKITLAEFLPDFSGAITPRTLGGECRAALLDHARGVETAAFEALDADHSGALNREEFGRNDRLPNEDVLRAEFDQGDADHDGYLSKAEHGALLAPPPAPPAEFNIDSEGEGARIVTIRRARGGKDIDQHWATKDGAVLDGEALVRRLAPGEAPPFKACETAGSPTTEVFLFIGGPADPAGAFKAADADSDGRLSFEEFAAGGA